MATRELARLYRDGGLASKAAECYYHHLLLTGDEALVTAVQKVVQGIFFQESNYFWKICFIIYEPFPNFFVEI